MLLRFSVTLLAIEYRAMDTPKPPDQLYPPSRTKPRIIISCLFLAGFNQGHSPDRLCHPPVHLIVFPVLRAFANRGILAYRREATCDD